MRSNSKRNLSWLWQWNANKKPYVVLLSYFEIVIKSVCSARGSPCILLKGRCVAPSNFKFLLCSNWKNAVEFNAEFTSACWLEFNTAKASDGCKELPTDGLEGCRRHNHSGLELPISRTQITRWKWWCKLCRRQPLHRKWAVKNTGLAANTALKFELYAKLPTNKNCITSNYGATKWSHINFLLDIILCFAIESNRFF